jgi:hypothetical protein
MGATGIKSYCYALGRRVSFAMMKAPLATVFDITVRKPIPKKVGMIISKAMIFIVGVSGVLNYLA